MKKKRTHHSKKMLINFLLVISLLFTLIIGTGIFATQTTISVSDGSISDWKGVAAFNDSYGDVSGVGPNDLIKLWVTSDSTNIYCRWDVILSGSKPQVTSAAYSLTINSVPATGTTRPSAEVRAYVAFDNKGVVSSISIENATKKISLPLTYAQQINTGVAKTLVSVEAMFPFASFNSNSMTVNTLGTANLFPLWGESLASGSFNSNVKDIVPDMGFLNYDAVNSICTPIGTGPVANIAIAAINNNVVPGATVDYVVTIKNVGDSTGNPNLLFNSIQWTLPTGFTYVSGSSTGLTTSNPAGTTGTLTWAITGGSLAPGASNNIHFKATASSTSGAYYSSAAVVATTPNITYETGDDAFVNIDSKYVVPNAPLNLAASNTTQTSTTLSWTSALNAVAYDIYDNNVEIATGIPYTTYTVTNLDPASTHVYTVRGVSILDVRSNASNAVTVTTLSPYVVTINNLVTNNPKPTITGTTTAPIGSTISLVINGKTYTGTVSSGSWSIAVTDALADNIYTVSSSILNAVSNTATGTVTIDTAAPAITVASFSTENTLPILSGTTDAANGIAVTVTVNSKDYSCTAFNGSWSVNTTSPLSVGTYSVAVKVTDTAGNTGTASGTVEIISIAKSSDNNLLNLTTSAGNVSPTFSSSVTEYTLSVANSVDSITLTPTVSDSKSTVKVNDTAVASGYASGSISLNEGANNLTVQVTAEDGSIKYYYITVCRAYHVIGVSLNKSDVSIYQFENITLTPTVTPDTAEDKTVVWSSSDENVATVDANGKVTGVAPGTAMTTVTTNDGGKTAACTVTVIKPEVSVSVTDGNKLKITIYGWNANYKYQIWTYQTVTSDIFLNASSNVKVKQWVLSSQYASASAAVQEADGSISYTVDLPKSTPDGNYIVAIKIQDENGNYIGELKDSYTPDSIGIVAISKVLVDGDTTFSNETKEIKSGASVSLKILGINSDTYSVKLGDTVLFAESSNNTYNWDISGMQPGRYSLVLTAKNAASGSTFSKTVDFNLYSKVGNTNYGVINTMTADAQSSSNQYKVSIGSQILNGDYFYYTIGEMGRTPLFSSGLLSVGNNYQRTFDKNMYGVYTVSGFVKRASSETYDDGMITNIVSKRNGTATLDVYADDVLVANSNPVSVPKGTSVTIKGIAALGNLTKDNIQYSFWRYDAVGFVLVKDWSNSDTLDWTPARAGAYSIQVRAKGTDAGSYEILKSIDVNVSTEETARNVEISINEAVLNANSEARVPIVINASATSESGEPLLYKFNVSDSNLGTMTLQQYSPIQSCQWTPRKAGTYTISILVKNSDSFGKYDAIKSYTITVK